jgi:hypothetical protein
LVLSRFRGFNVIAQWRGLASVEVKGLSGIMFGPLQLASAGPFLSPDRSFGKSLESCEEYRPLLKWVEMRFLSASGLAALAEHLDSPAEWAWGGIADRLPVLDSVIISDFPDIFADFREKRFSLLWLGSRDGFGTRDFRSRCDGHANTLTVILDRNGNIFGGFTPVEWDSRVWNENWSAVCKADVSLKSFLFTLKNAHNFPARRFALKAEKKDGAICCYFSWGPHFFDIGVCNNSNASTNSYTCEFGFSYTNDTGLDGMTFFTGSKNFTWLQLHQVKDIEVFEITD